jgi:hypothetical protein
MPALLGFVLGVVLTVACAYEYDSQTGRASSGMTGPAAPMVNWGVVSDDWQNLQAHMRATADNLEQKLKQHS